MTVTPGFLRSEAVLDHFGVKETNWRDAIAEDPFFAESETPMYVGRGIAALAIDPNRRVRAGLTFSAGELAKLYEFTDVDGRTPQFFARLEQKTTELAVRSDQLDEMEHFLVWSRYCQIHQNPDRREEAARLFERLEIFRCRAGLATSLRAAGPNGTRQLTFAFGSENSASENSASEKSVGHHPSRRHIY